ncbi:uncharacterized protein LOC117782786 [Drosophila innubila]|uniref:uncharacterized protein LOC117782786 n=1 Tax=Drosophila innubila TaxID=198719 RepID=UPI00148D59D0|nr:uncharacterized protein LOC117782786 [Drosophila innubila]
MSMLRHDIFEIILMVIVVILARPLPCSSTNFNKYGIPLKPLPRGERLLESVASNMENDPSALFDQLDRETPAKNLPKWHNFMDMVKINNAQKLAKAKEKESPDKADDVENELEFLLPLPLTAANNDARQQEQRQRHFERLQNEAADREFDEVMRKLKLKMQLERDNVLTMKSVAKKDQFKNKLLGKPFNFCKKKTKTKPTTTTVFPSTVGPSTVFPSTVAPSTVPNPDKSKPIGELTPEDVDRLLRTLMSMKKHALLILKNLNLLEIELMSRWPDSCAASDVAQTTSSDKPEYTHSTETTKEYASKTHERLDKPTTTTPFMFNRSFYFGLRGAGEGETDLNMDAALREQRKLEQKIREEYQMQHDMMRSENQRRLLQRLKSNRKRARYEAAPAAAARLEIMTTPSSNIMVNTKVNQQIPHVKQSSAAIKSLTNKIRAYANRNHIDLASQPLHSWEIMRKYTRKRKTKLLAPAILEGVPGSANKKIASATCVRPQRRHSRIRERLPLNNPLLTPS